MSVSDLLQSKWFPLLVDEVELELIRLQETTVDFVPNLLDELSDVKAKIQGWALTLSKPDLASSVRTAIESEMDSVLSRQHELELALSEIENKKSAKSLIDPAMVAKTLTNLGIALADGNTNRTNLELSQHIDRISCDRDGNVVVRTCRLGALAPVRSFFEVKESLNPTTNTHLNGKKIKKQCRRRLQFNGLSNETKVSRSIVDFVADPDRFAGLGDSWFWEDVFQVPDKSPWYIQNALAVATKRAETGWSYERLSKYFNKCEPTILKAFRYAKTLNTDIAKMPKKMPKPKWEDSHYLEVAKLRKEGLSLAAIGQKLKISTPMVRKAVDLAQSLSEQQVAQAVPEEQKAA